MRDRQIEIGVCKVLESLRNRIINDVTTKIIMKKKEKRTKPWLSLSPGFLLYLDNIRVVIVTEGQFESEFDRVWGDFMARVAIQ